MTTPRWGGRRIAQLRTEVEATYGRTCWLCGGHISEQISLDHTIPRAHLDPALWYSLEYLRPSHPSCNSSRGKKPPGATSTRPKPSRTW